jgi:hypothetical protein
MAALRNKKGRRSALIIPDAHATPDYCNTRFDWLGRFARQFKPDYVICLGDWWDFPSLSRHDPLGSRTMDGVSYEKDVEAGNDAMDRFRYAMGPAFHRSRNVFCLGNHDVRPDLYTNERGNLEGTVTMNDLWLEDWEVIPYRDIFTFEGIAVSHHMSAGVSGRPIGGVSAARQLVQKGHTSSIVGHSHVIDHSEHTRRDGQKIFGLVAGCYSHPHYGKDHQPRSNWCRDTRDMWWRGVVTMGDLDGAGYYDRIDKVTMRYMKRHFGG